MGGPKVQHALMLINFFTFSVALITADIATDISTALDFLKRGDFYWGLFTLIPIFAPLMGQILITLSSLIAIRRKTRQAVKPDLKWYWKNGLSQLAVHIPMVQPFR